MRDIIPLLFCDLGRGWNGAVLATDAQGDSQTRLGGYGITEREMGSTVASQIGIVSEKWRYDVEDAIKARHMALSGVDAHSVQADLGTRGLVDLADFLPESPSAAIHVAHDTLKEHAGLPSQESPFSYPHRTRSSNFHSVTLDMVGDKSLWKLCFNGRWSHPQTILQGEGRAALLGLKHHVRAFRNFNTHHTILIDNLPIVLSMGKGRASSRGINQVCREFCSLLLCTNCSVHAR